MNKRLSNEALKYLAAFTFHLDYKQLRALKIDRKEVCNGALF